MSKSKIHRKLLKNTVTFSISRLFKIMEWEIIEGNYVTITDRMQLDETTIEYYVRIKENETRAQYICEWVDI